MTVTEANYLDGNLFQEALQKLNCSRGGNSPDLWYCGEVSVLLSVLAFVILKKWLFYP